MVNKIFNYNEIQKKCEKLYSDIICFNIYDLRTKGEQWKKYHNEMDKVINESQGEYDSLNLHDEIFSIGDKVIIHYMTGRIAIIKAVSVRLDYCTWKPEYTIESEDIHTGEVYNTSYDVCIHLV